MAPELKKAKFWLLANFVGIGAFLYVASRTWNINFAIVLGLSIEGALLILILFFNLIVNLFWVILILVRVCRAKVWLSLVIWLMVGALWAVAYEYHLYRFSLEVEAAKHV